MMIFDRVQSLTASVSDGANRGEVTMNDLDLIIKKAAGNVYARLLEDGPGFHAPTPGFG